MSIILSYGEDPLTYWVLTRRVPQFLSQLSDPTLPEKLLIIYRPSFGRGGSAKASSQGSFSRAEFGEFDAIVRSERAVYLVEAKWSRSSESHEAQVLLSSNQIRRHDIFRWLLEQWRTTGVAAWPAFCAAVSRSYSAAFPGFRLAPVGSLLATNLEFVLGKLSGAPTPVRDVLLHIGLPGFTAPVNVMPRRFELVHLEAEPVSPGGYFELQ